MQFVWYLMFIQCNSIQYNKGMSQKQTSYSLRQKKDKGNEKYSKYNVVILALITAVIIFIIINYMDSNLFRHLMSHTNFDNSSNSDNHKKAPYLISNPKPLQKQIQYSISSKLTKIDKNNKHISKFTLNRPSITFNGPSKKWTQLLTQKPILHNQTYSIKAVISYSSHSEIMLGVTNTNRINEDSSFFNEDTYVYYGNNGCLWAQGILMIKDQVGFKEKDVLQVIVQLWNGLIQWKVNDQIRGQIYSDNLKNKEKKFVAYLEMFEKNDQIRQILEQSGSNSSAQI